MVARGNLIAGLRKAELQQLDDTLTKLHTASTTNSLIPRGDSVMQNFEAADVTGEGSVAAIGLWAHLDSHWFFFTIKSNCQGVCIRTNPTKQKTHISN